MGKTPEDIDKSFDHMIDNLDCDPEQTDMLWMFSFRHDEDPEKLEKFGESLVKRFAGEADFQHEMVLAQDDSDAQWTALAITVQTKMSRDQAKRWVRTFSALAEENGVEYEDHSCFEAFDWDEFEKPMNAQDAAWRLRHLTDCGLPAGAPLLWILAFTATDPAVAESFEGVLREAGFDEIERSENEEDAEDREYYIDAVLLRSNTEAGLPEQHAAAEKLASAHGVRFEGFQFADPGPDEPER
ncbi:MAG: hypothetical protein EA423_03570 [Phycisphaerales bacterium]|nr:MAG: hypothetical protein EA423_03570 [Phycisphaerales bacterium]